MEECAIMGGLVERKCPICGVSYGLDEDFYRYRLKGGTMGHGKKACWYCPNGHELIVTDSEADVLRRERDRLVQRLAQKDDEIKDTENRRRAAVGQVTKLRNRIGRGVCPCCNRSFENLHRHMETKHPDFT